MNGHGVTIPDWQGGLTARGVNYQTGPAPEGVVELNNQVVEDVKPIWNLYSIIPGSVAPEEIILLGNHRDAWHNGAADPISGTTAMTQTIDGVGALLKKGWEPHRTLVFASWDAEEYGLIGSTEFGEDFARLIKKRVAMYFNVDVAVAGSRFKFGASPSLVELFKSVTGKVPAPDEEGKTLTDYLIAQEHIPQLGSGSDYTVFLQHLGIASVDIGFAPGKEDPGEYSACYPFILESKESQIVYHYHSMYDSQAWMERYGDPQQKRNVAM